jgi:hypothetical protein
MNKILRHVKQKEKRKNIVTSKRFYYVAAAAILIFGLRIGLPALVINEKSHEKGNETAIKEDSTNNAIESGTAKSADTKASPQEAPFEEKSDQSASSNERVSNIAFEYEGVNDTDVTLILSNRSDTEISYSSVYLVEKLIGDDTWQVVCSFDSLVEETLQPSSQGKETLNRLVYHMDTSGTYRLFRNVNKEPYVVEVTIP